MDLKKITVVFVFACLFAVTPLIVFAAEEAKAGAENPVASPVVVTENPVASPASAHINIIDVMGFGKFGRVYIGGEEAEVLECKKAVEKRLSEISGRSLKEDYK